MNVHPQDITLVLVSNEIELKPLWAYTPASN